MKEKQLRILQDYSLLLAVTLLAYWPLSSFLCGVKGDAINYFLAMRVNSSEAIQHGIFPFWSPYINLGYPLHADMQAGVWNPVALLLSLFGTYNIYLLQIETLLTIFLSGISMHLLCGYWGLSRRTRISIAVAWMLSGYITDAGQFLNWLYAAAYLPLVFFTALRCFGQFRAKDAFFLGAAASLLLLSAYPADVILTGYLLLAFLAFSFYRYQKTNAVKSAAKLYGRQLLISGCSFLLISLPAILSYIPFLQTFNRGSGISLELAMTNTLAPANLISFLYPWSVQRLNWWQTTDPLIRNCYIGLLPLMFFVLYFIRRKNKPGERFFLTGVFIFFLLFSLGESGFVRTISYYFLPFMDSFRHPANAKLFFLFAAILLAAFSIDDYQQYANAYNRKLRQLILFAGILTIVVSGISISYSRIFNDTGLLAAFSDRNAIKSVLNTFTFADFLSLNTIFAASLLFLTYWLVNKNRLSAFLPFLIIIDLIITAQLMLPLTSYRVSSPAITQTIQKAQPSGYPLPSLDQSLAENGQDGMLFFDKIGCMNPYNKKPGRSDYIITPSNLKWQEEFWNYNGFRDKMLQNPVAYLADTIWQIKDSAAFVLTGDPKGAALADMATTDYSAKASYNKDSLRLDKFSPEGYELTTWTSSGRLLVLQQNRYPNWEVFVNGKKVSPIPVNISFMGVWVDKGETTVRFHYKTGMILYAAIISLLFTLGGLLYFSIKSSR